MYGPGRNDTSFLELLQSFDNNLLTRLESLVNHPHRSDRRAGLHGAHANFVITADNRHLIAPLRLRNGALRQQQSAFFQFGFDTYASVLARTENLAGIGKGSNDANRARVCIYLPVRQQDFSFLQVVSAVRQDQLERISEKTDGVLPRDRIAVPPCYEILMFVNREKSFDRIH